MSLRDLQPGNLFVQSEEQRQNFSQKLDALMQGQLESHGLQDNQFEIRSRRYPRLTIEFPRICAICASCIILAVAYAAHKCGRKKSFNRTFSARKRVRKVHKCG